MTEPDDVRFSALVIDDDADLRFMVRLTLEREADGGRVVGEASSGALGLALWRQLRPDVVVLDARLPDGSGLEVAGRILAEDPATCIILLSALIDSGIEREAAEIGIRACLSKMEIRRLPGLARWGCAMGSGDG